MKKTILALIGPMLFTLTLFAACGEQAKITDVQNGVTLSSSKPVPCKGAALNGNDWYENGEVWTKVGFITLSKPTKVERSGMNYCRNLDGTPVTLTIEENKTGKARSFTTSAKYFYFEIYSTAKIVGEGIKEIGVDKLSLFDVAVTTTSRNEMFVKAAYIGDKEISLIGGKVFNSTTGLTLSSLPPGVVKLLVCFNEAGTDTCNDVVQGGKMDPQNGIYLKAVKANFAPYKVISYVEDPNKEQNLVAELMSDGSFSAPGEVHDVDFTIVDTKKPITPTTPTCTGIQVTGACAIGNSIQHVGYTGDIANWGQANENVFRMTGTAEAVSLIADSTRKAGTVVHVDLNGQVSNNPDNVYYRQLRTTVNALNIGQRYEADYCVWSSSGGLMGVELHQSSGSPGQPWPNDGIYVTVVLPPSTWVCDGWTFVALLNTQQYYNLHIANLSGTLLADDVVIK